MFRNPIFNRIQKNLNQEETQYGTNSHVSSQAQTYQNAIAKPASYKGLAIKLFITYAVFFISIAFVFVFLYHFIKTDQQVLFRFISVVIPVSLIGGIISVLIASFSVRLAPIFTLLFALFEGLMVGVISALVSFFVSPLVGIVAAAITAAIVLSVSTLYSFKIVRVTTKFRKVVYASMIAFFITVIFTSIIYFATGQSLSSAVGLSPQAQFGISVAITVLYLIFGVMMLFVDFDNASILVKIGAPSRYEWQAVLGIFVTIVWIYLQLLELVLLLFGRRN